mgnify:CR=1 FL=1
METEIIIEEWSPVCNIQAFVEKRQCILFLSMD